MGYLDQALGIAGALGRAYTGYSTGQVQKPQGRPGGTSLMDYIQKRGWRHGSGEAGREGNAMPQGSNGDFGGETSDLPTGQQPVPSGAPPIPVPPMTSQVQGPVPPMPPSAPPSAPPSNPYQNPYPLQPPPTDQEDPNAVVPGSMQGQRFAQGTVVSQPTNAIIGEDGPEMVVPLSGRADAKVSPRNLPQMQYGRR